jgi:hypothetical protein
MTPFVKGASIACLVLILSFLVAVTFLYSPWEAGASALFIFLALVYLVLVLHAWRTNRYHLEPGWRWSVSGVVIVTLVLGIGVGSQTNKGFFGFSIILFVVFAYLCLNAIKFNRLAAIENRPYYWTSRLFPVYQYIPEATGRDKLVVSYDYPAFIYAAFATWYVWGALAAWFITPAWIGISLLSLALVFAFAFSLSRKFHLQVQLAKAASFLVEGSRTYDRVAADVSRQAEHDLTSHRKSIETQLSLRAQDSEDTDLSRRKSTGRHQSMSPLAARRASSSSTDGSVEVFPSASFEVFVVCRTSDGWVLTECVVGMQDSNFSFDGGYNPELVGEVLEDEHLCSVVTWVRLRIHRMVIVAITHVGHRLSLFLCEQGHRNGRCWVWISRIPTTKSHLTKWKEC